MSLGHRLQFLREYLRHPTVVGSMVPSSRSLASALCEPFRRHAGPARLLEVGAGTGSITRYLGSVLGDEDELDICEIKPEFLDILEKEVLTRDDFAPAVATDRVRLLATPVQEIGLEDNYDFVISGLPFTAFEVGDVRQVFEVVQRLLKPGGVFSYFEYMGLRKLSQLLAVGRKRTRIRDVSTYLTQNIRHHQFARRAVLRNLPPAHARYMKFDCSNP